MMIENALPIGLLRLWRNVPFTEADYSADEPERIETMDIREAQVVSSEMVANPGFHLVLLDIDIPAHLIASSTEGHFHLYIEKALPWAKYVRLLEALAEAEIIETGYAAASIKRGMTFLRLPWVKKLVPDA